LFIQGALLIQGGNTRAEIAQKYNIGKIIAKEKGRRAEARRL
jgi:hypothetical protein